MAVVARITTLLLIVIVAICIQVSLQNQTRTASKQQKHETSSLIGRNHKAEVDKHGGTHQSKMNQWKKSINPKSINQNKFLDGGHYTKCSTHHEQRWHVFRFLGQVYRVPYYVTVKKCVRY